MSIHRISECSRGVSEVPLRRAHRERQTRELGDCGGCFLPIARHFAGPHCTGRKLSCEEVLRLALALESVPAGERR